MNEILIMAVFAAAYFALIWLVSLRPPRVVDPEDWRALCGEVLDDVGRERVRQVNRYGHNDDLDLGMGPDIRWLLPYTSDSAHSIEKGLRDDYEDFEEDAGKPTWLHLIREEVAELFQEGDLRRVEEEAVQVAALCVSLVETIRKGREE